MNHKMKILVTGGTGFIGRHVTRELLLRGHTVDVLVRGLWDAEVVPYFSFDAADVPIVAHPIRGDIFKPETLPNLRGYDALVHLAWSARSDYLTTTSNLDHVSAAVTLAHAALASGTVQHVCMAGSSFEYAASSEPVTESARLTPLTDGPLYVACKRLAYVAIDMAVKCEVRFLWPRVFQPYGPGESFARLLPTLVRSSRRRDGPIPVSSGKQVRDFIHVRDVALAIAHLLDGSIVSGPVNVGTGIGTSVRDVILAVAAELGVVDRLAWNTIPLREGERECLVADNTLLRTTGFTPHIAASKGISEYIRFLDAKES